MHNELRKQKDKMKFLAHHDTLTCLPNRMLYEDRLRQAIIKAERNKTKTALFFIDLDKFKDINDTFGHRAGDAVLKNVSKRVENIIRKEDTIARIGGDEFVLIMENIVKIENTVLLSNKLIEVITKPIYFEDYTLNISASIGISIYPDDETDADKLLSKADTVMYRAKNTKTNRGK